MKTTLETIVELHQVLTELARNQQRHDEVPESMRELHDEHGTVRAEIERLETELGEADQSRRTAEAGALDAQQKINHYQQQINLVSTQREYGALLSEIDTARGIKQEHEEAALAEIERHEESARQGDELKERFTELDSSYAEELDKWEKDKPEIAEEIERLKGRAEVLRESLSASILRKFELLFERHDGDPMARIEKVERTGKSPTMYRCSVCNYSVRPQVVVEIQTRGDLVTCDCGRQRIFYLDSD